MPLLDLFRSGKITRTMNFAIPIPSFSQVPTNMIRYVVGKFLVIRILSWIE